jgi:hypothetical protein
MEPEQAMQTVRQFAGMVIGVSMIVGYLLWQGRKKSR